MLDYLKKKFTKPQIIHIIKITTGKMKQMRANGKSMKIH